MLDKSNNIRIKIKCNLFNVNNTNVDINEIASFFFLETRIKRNIIFDLTLSFLFSNLEVFNNNSRNKNNEKNA